MTIVSARPKAKPVTIDFERNSASQPTRRRPASASVRAGNDGECGGQRNGPVLVAVGEAGDARARDDGDRRGRADDEVRRRPEHGIGDERERYRVEADLEWHARDRGVAERLGTISAVTTRAARRSPGSRSRVYPGSQVGNRRARREPPPGGSGVGL